MQTPPISNEVALRIALASKLLPQISLPDLITALQTHFNDEVTETALNQLTITELQQCLTSVDGTNTNRATLKEALHLLWGETDENLPIPEAGDLPQSVKIAVASNTGEELDGHFGSCHRYLIYQLAVDEMRLIDVRSTIDADWAKDKTEFRVNLIRDCAIVYMVAIGGPAAAKVIQANIYPMKKEQGGLARDHLAQLQQVLATSPPPWLAKALGLQVKPSFSSAVN
ncbi:Dinitrogenase iron-molybdenum cofactor biosynthesis protein [Halothece sp. PCC 7418]|uniref:dinitrogenase iron-molybdenum cofactor biosynthesis protein n=1 Tax=Halothece sp. (strain PCC 7418) TaxID=65093 RepID=UPI0002A05E3C|nr:dinitrogenase iron-molybdenum cofactor biosynthesis protein [Halothece sp. PCC 7418]AFZ43422.1 Dinitrogenase iron-molybdenum cofactor biosynthesis protein [Halothece sp. PCC 7418]